jgi:hypothetical protein
LATVGNPRILSRYLSANWILSAGTVPSGFISTQRILAFRFKEIILWLSWLAAERGGSLQFPHGAGVFQREQN